MRLYLASTSPARRALLEAAGVDPVLIAPGVDEEAAVAAAEREAGGPLPTEEMVQLLARLKAEAVVGRTVDGEPIDGFILGGDSSFLLDGISHGKPHTPERARERWLAQRGRTGQLWSGHWLIDHRGGRANAAAGRAAVASVTFAEATEAEIDAYVATGEPLEVAGAFTVDSLGGPFITRVEGDPSTVVGLSLSTLRELVRELGADWPTFWRASAQA